MSVVDLGLARSRRCSLEPGVIRYIRIEAEDGGYQILFLVKDGFSPEALSGMAIRLVYQSIHGMRTCTGRIKHDPAADERAPWFAFWLEPTYTLPRLDPDPETGLVTSVQTIELREWNRWIAIDDDHFVDRRDASATL